MQTVRSTKKLAQIAPGRFRSFGCAASASIAVVPFALGSAILVTPRQATAEVTTFSTSNRVYKVGILLIDSTADGNITGTPDGIVDANEAVKGAENPDPHMFYIADQRSDLKPAGWTLDNPLAPATITTDIYSRWSGVGGRDPGHPYIVGQKVTKDMAAYWEVPLTRATEAELLQYDVLFITTHRTTRFSPRDREKLRKVVDAGGIVFLDNCGGMTIEKNGRFFLEELQMNNGATGLNNSPGPTIYQPTHPLLNSPYTLSFNDILTLGDKGYGDYYLTTQPLVGGVIGTAPNKDTLTTIIGNRKGIDSVTGLALPYVSAGIYGSGAVIVSSADVGCGINDYSGGFNAGVGGNSGAYAGKNLLAANSEDLKFLYNSMAWGGANNTVRRNNRRIASSSSAVTAPLNPSFDFTDTPTNAVNSASSPLISQGIMYVSGVDASNNLTLRAYDTVPNRDYDADGNNDEGLPDLIQGTPYDEIWRWQGGASGGRQPSSPVLATVNIGGLPVDKILIALPDGTVIMFDAKPINPATGRLAPQQVNAPLINGPTTTGGVFTSATNGVAPSPVFFGNKVYAVEPNSAIVRCINASGFGLLWHSSDATPGYQPTGTPTLGLNRLVVNRNRGESGTGENSIAATTNESSNDVMLYVPVLDGDGSSKILPFFLGARNEGTNSNTFNGTDNIMPLRLDVAADQKLISKGKLTDPLSPFITPSVTLYADVTFFRGTANEVTYTREENFAAGRAVFPGPDPFFTAIDNTYGGWNAVFTDSTVNTDYFSGRINVSYTGDTTKSSLNRVLAVADYDTVYLPNGGAGSTFLASNPGHRGVQPLTIRGATGLDTVAFAPGDLLMYSANQAGPGVSFGAVFAMQEREFSPNASRLRWRYLLHGGYSGVQINGQTVSDLPALRNRMVFDFTGPTPDPLNKPAGLSTTTPFYEDLTGVQTVGSPITTNEGITYVLASANSLANGPVSVLMAFQTATQITLDLGVPLDVNSSVSITQWDPVNGVALPPTSGDANDHSRLDIDYQSGKVVVSDFRDPNNPDALLSASSTFIVSYSPQGSDPTTKVREPAIKAFTPFGTLPNVTAANTEQVLDANTGSSSGGFSPLLWYYVLPGAPSGASPTKIGDQIFLTTTTKIIAVDADPAGNDPTVRVRSGEQVYGVTDTVGTRKVSRNHVRWTAGIASGASPSGGEGVLALNTGAGTISFSEGLTLLADSSRVMEVNADGAAVWIADGTTSGQTVGGESPIYDVTGALVSGTSRGREAVDAKSFSTPQSVRRLGSSDYLVADTGNNRVVRFDRGGVTRWSATRITDPYNILAPGDPLTLDTPTDVLTRRIATFDAGSNRIGYEDHYIIADSGNGRIIDVVDYFGLDARPREPIVGKGSSGIVVWTTRTKSKNGENLTYRNLQLIGSNTGGVAGKPILVASVSNQSVAAANNDKANNGGGGSLVQLDYNPYNTGFVLVDATTGVFSSIGYYWTQERGVPRPYDPLTLAVTGIAEPPRNGTPLLAINELRTFAGGVVTATKPLNAPTYFEQIPLNLDGDAAAESVYLIADSGGVYACTVSTVGTQSFFDVIWQFDQASYDFINTGNAITAGRLTDRSGRAFGEAGFDMTGTIAPRFAPVSLKRLANGNYLITNTSVGASAVFESGQFLGEAFEVKPSGLITAGIDPTTGAVTTTQGGGTFAGFSAPRIVKGSSITANAPRVLNKQQMGRDANGATLTEQLHSADRL